MSLLSLAAVLVSAGVRMYPNPQPQWAVTLLIILWVLLGVLIYSGMPYWLEFREVRRVEAVWGDKWRRRTAAGAHDIVVDGWSMPRQVPDLEIYLLCTFLGVSIVSMRGLLEGLDSRAGIGPADAPAIVGAVASVPALIALAVGVVPRVIRAWGSKAKDTGEGDGAAAAGRADIIRAEKEGEAAVIRARAELVRAEAEMKRAELGLEPLPPTYVQSPPDTPPALDGPRSNGDPTSNAAPPDGRP
ncbi:hypothetical protein ACFVZZ_11745 [Streptomyces chartreusis]|uniref:hypothetical protein n=1 Tax=Streptomyces chartreusis TaxID=1969 RepID=UPI0036DAB14A